MMTTDRDTQLSAIAANAAQLSAMAAEIADCKKSFQELVSKIIQQTMNADIRQSLQEIISKISVPQREERVNSMTTTTDLVSQFPALSTQSEIAGKIQDVVSNLGGHSIEESDSPIAQHLPCVKLDCKPALGTELLSENSIEEDTEQNEDNSQPYVHLSKSFVARRYKLKLETDLMACTLFSEQLHKTPSGWGINGDLIIKILGHRNSARRKVIKQVCATTYDEDLAVKGILEFLDEISTFELLKQFFICALASGLAIAEANVFTGNLSFSDMLMECKKYIVATFQNKKSWVDKLDEIDSETGVYNLIHRYDSHDTAELYTINLNSCYTPNNCCHNSDWEFVLSQTKKDCVALNLIMCLKRFQTGCQFAESVFAKPHYAQLKGSDTSATESDSEADDIASPKLFRSYSGMYIPRYGNYTTVVAAQKISALEGDESTLLMASGMYASTSLLTSLVPEESPTNPFLRCVDIQKVSDFGHRKGTLVCVDATFATPVDQKSLVLGADIAVHSATEYLAGHNAIFDGSISDPEKLIAPIRNLHHALEGILPNTLVVCWVCNGAPQILVLWVTADLSDVSSWEYVVPFMTISQIFTLEVKRVFEGPGNVTIREDEDGKVRILPDRFILKEGEMQQRNEENFTSEEKKIES